MLKHNSMQTHTLAETNTATQKEITVQVPQPNIVRPVDISSLPEFPSNVGRNSSRCGSANVITSSPYKTCLAESIERKKTIAALKELVHGEKKMKILRTLMVRIFRFMTVHVKVMALRMMRMQSVCYVAAFSPRTNMVKNGGSASSDMDELMKIVGLIRVLCVLR
ncbi:hypothetical protein PR048_018754, partial [Dryococelus australis]